MKLVTKVALGVAGVGFVASPTIADAGVAKQGSDTTEYYASTFDMEVCDKESDGQGVHGDFTFNQNHTTVRVDEQGGAASACDRERPGSLGLQGLWRHRTVEEDPDILDGDYQSAWKYH